MMNDLVNGMFELFGGIFAWINVYALFRDMQINGVYWPIWFFYSVWGLWNLYYYPELNQWISFYAGIFLTSANCLWFLVAIYIKFSFIRSILIRFMIFFSGKKNH